MYDLHWNKKMLAWHVVFLACVFATCAPLGAYALDPPSGATVSDVPTDAELAGTNCAIGEERFLPADYYYCLGTQNYGARRYTYANKFFTTAASWASKPAQYVLGVMALNGDQQPVNRPLALAWFTLAAERPNSNFKSAYDDAYRHAMPAERAAAAHLLLTMRPVYADAVAAVRAENRYIDGMKVLNRLNNGGNQYCLEGTSSLATGPTDPTICMPVQKVVQVVDQTAATVFDGWSGHVTVEPLQPVASPTPTQNGGKQ
jgi:TPR repeat protein